jgi:hypothetical protein
VQLHQQHGRLHPHPRQLSVLSRELIPHRSHPSSPYLHHPTPNHLVTIIQVNEKDRSL